METTFDRFSDLPRELRDEIWRFAIRTTHPGVHIFRLSDDFKDDHAGARDILSLARFFTGECLAEPSRDRYFHNTNTDCGDRNVSTYLIDDGLWTACKESRLLMEKRFRNSEWGYLRKQQSAGRPLERIWKLWFLPATGYFTSSSGAPHYFTVIPCRDLFVLQPDLLGNTDGDWVDLKLPEGLTERARHIAIEYNPEWDIQLRKASPHERTHPIIQALISSTLNAHGDLRLWLIDHSLKREKDAPVFKEVLIGYSTNAFYASDRKFLEVECGSGALNLDHWQRTRQVGERVYDEPSLFFLSSLRKEVNELEDCFGLLGWDEL